MVDVGSGLDHDDKPTNTSAPTPRPPKIDSSHLKGLAWCVKQAFSVWNRKGNVDWTNPSASGERLLEAEQFLRKHLSDNAYFKVFKQKKAWGAQFD
jgi:hypothetical protein